MLPKDLTKDVSDRLKSIRGQVDGLMKMIDAGKDPDAILNQFKAAGKALETAQELLVDEVYRKSLAIKIVETVDACPGDCGSEDVIQSIKHEFPTIKPQDLTAKMKEIKTIADNLSEKKEEKK